MIDAEYELDEFLQRVSGVDGIREDLEEAGYRIIRPAACRVVRVDVDGAGQKYVIGTQLLEPGIYLVVPG